MWNPDRRRQRRRRPPRRGWKPGRGRRSGGLRPWRKVLVLLIASLAIVTYLEQKQGALSALSGTIDCRVTLVVDGDTVRVWCPGRGVFKARLVGYDAPEVFSPDCMGERWRGTEATMALRSLLWRADDLAFAFRGTDKYGRRLLRLTVDGRDVAERMVEAGHGRRYDGGRRRSWCG